MYIEQTLGAVNSGKLKIDNLPTTENKRVVIWGNDNYLKHRNFNDLLEGAEFKGPFVITNSQGDTIFLVNEYGNSLHVGDERFEKKIIVTSPDGEGRVEISPFGIKMYYGQEETMILDPFGYSWHKGREYFENGITVADEITVTDTIPSIEAGIIRAEKIIAKEKDFQIDHPLYPDEMYLNHTSIESDDMKNMYDGTVVLNSEGEAYVLLPEWFQALNNDFRYQLTCIGGYAPVFIASEIANNQFKIAGGNPGMKVSWQVTGIRHDKWALENKRPVEQWKKRTP